MSFTLADIPDLTDVTAVVTGANSGLGLETAKALAGAGAHVVMTCRSEAKYQPAAKAILDADPDAKIELVVMDLADLSSVADAAATISGRHADVDILVNNAGIMMTPESTTADGLEMQLGTNHFGHFAFTGRLLDVLLASGAARVVTVSSLVHHQGVMDFDDLHQREGSYSTSAGYGRSKLANLLFALELQRRFSAADVAAESVAAHPGYSATNLQSTGVRSSGAGWQQKLLDVGMRITNAVMAQPASQGALPQIYAAVADVPGGTYWGPDGYRELRGGGVGPAAINGKAKKIADAERLWDVSVETTGVDYAALRGAD